MEDWHDILPTGKYAPAYRIQWNPKGYVRAKRNQELYWKQAKCSKAMYAESIGLALLESKYSGEYTLWREEC